MHYHFDSSGRILFAAFAQSPQTEGIDPPTSAPFYTNDYPALKRALSSYEYEPGGRMTKLENNWQVWGGSSYSDTKIQRSEYSYDSTLGLKTNANFNQNNGSNAWAQYHKQAYDYDADLDYLIQAKYDDDGNNSWDETVDWTYDTAGSRASDTSNSGSWTYDYLNRMSASPGVSYTNDILGNRTFADKTGTVNDVTYTWDALNRLITYDKNGGARHYAYRADGMRVSKIRGSGGQEDTTYRYDGQMLMEEYFAGTEYPRDYLQVIRYGLGARGIDYIERVRTQSGTDVGFPLYDGHGNMIGTLMRHSTSGFTVGDTRRYGAWGDIRSGNTTGEPNPRYCANLGHVQDDESGLIYMRARYYEASSGRFISEDPSAHGRNFYVYASSDPVNRVDADGQRDYLGRIIASFFWIKASVHFGVGYFAAWASNFAVGAERAELLIVAISQFTIAVQDYTIAFAGGSLTSSAAVVMAYLVNTRPVQQIILSVTTGIAAGSTGHAAVAVMAIGGYSLLVLGAILAGFLEG
jgi:RHS repeat-associated protein